MQTILTIPRNCSARGSEKESKKRTSSCGPACAFNNWEERYTSMLVREINTAE